MQHYCTPFPILNQSLVPCPVLSVASWPAYRFLRRQVWWSGTPISLRTFHSLWYTQRFYNSQQSRCFSEISLLSPWSNKCWQFNSSASLKSKFYIWIFSVHVLLKSSFKEFEHNLTNMQNEHNCMVGWTFFDIAFLWDWNENWPFPLLFLWPLLSFPNLLACWVQHLHSIIF